MLEVLVTLVVIPCLVIIAFGVIVTVAYGVFWWIDWLLMH